MTSRTGLQSSPTKKIYKNEEMPTLQLLAFAKPAPLALKPFAGLYNPYPFGCSLLCNHPTDSDAKSLLRKAKNNLIDARDLELERSQSDDSLQEQTKPIVGVPEELFRRYTETDSRPLTPAPTLASATTRASGSRRCVTPDPHCKESREKTLLVLDLRRSHSQETFSYHGSSSLHDPPIIRIEKVATRAASFEDENDCKSRGAVTRSPTPVKAQKKKTKEVDEEQTVKEKREKQKEENAINSEDEDDECIKRRGKKRRKKRDSLQAPLTFQTSIEPETQMAAIGPDSHNPSARPSLVASEDPCEGNTKRKTSAQSSREWESDSYLDVQILRQLRRELNEEIVDNEFDHKRRAALQEALKTVSKDKANSAALSGVQKELKIATANTELWLFLPRIFTRSSARFELPLDGRSLESLTPLLYVQNHVAVSSPKKLLYNCVFNRFKKPDAERKIAGKDIQAALDLMMGKPMTVKQQSEFRDLMEWDDVVDFKTFCGLCALCERLFASECCTRTQDRKSDPCHEIESADFEGLERKLHGRNVNVKLVEMLQGIKTR